MTPGDQVLELKLKEIRADAELNVRAVDPKDEATRELAASIKAQGVLQPVTVTKDGKGYRLDFGFRRFHAAKLAGLTTIPAIVREFTEGQIVEAQLVENVQRESLTPLEEARAIQKLLDAEPDRKQAELAKQLGKSQPWISNRLRLLELPDLAVKAIESGQLSPTHGEIMLQLPKEATPNEVKEVLDRQKYNDMSAGTFKRFVRDRAATINRRTKAKQQRRGAIARAKFPTCPVDGCGKNGSPEQEWTGSGSGYSKEFRCRNGHRWDSVTGKVVKKQTQRTVEPEAPRAPPPPTLPEVSRVILEHPEASVIARRLLDSAGEIVGVAVEADQGSKGGLVLHLHVKAGELGKVEIPPFQVGAARGDDWSLGKEEKGHVRMEREYSWKSAQGTDRGRRECAKIRQAMIDWLATIRAPGRPRKDAETSPATEAAAATAPARGPGSKKSKKARAPAASHADGPDPPTEPAAPASVAEPPAAPAEAVAVTGAGTDGP